MNREVFHFIVKTVNPIRLLNLAKVLISYLLSILLKSPIVWGLPPIIMIEPTNICNLKCPMCPSGNGSLKREKGFMNFDTFKMIIDQTYKKSMMLLLWNQGEPFLNKDIFKMTKYASQKGLYVILSTNASLDLNPKDVVNSGIDTLIFSLDGITQKTYEQYRVGGNLSKVFANLKDIIAEKEKQNSKLPLIEWQFIVFRHNENEIETVKKVAKSLKVDFLKLKTAQIYTKEDVKYLPKYPRYRRYKMLNGNFEIKFKLKNRCRRIWTQPVINQDGEMAVCCFDKDNTIKIGNIKEKRFSDLWNSENYNNFRKKVLKNRKSIPICRNCGEGVKLKFIVKNINR